MLRLAVTTRAESFGRMRDPLADRGVELVHVDPRGEATPLSEPSVPDVDVGFVYPSRLMEGAVLDAALSVPWVNGRDAVLTSRNKAGVLARLAAADVPVPETVHLSHPVSDADLRAAFERVGAPAVVKPNSATRGVGVTRASDLDSLRGVADYLDLVHDFRATGDKSALLQAFVPDATDYRVMVVDGAYAGAVERRGEGWTHNVHRGARAQAADPGSAVREVAERAAAVLDVRYLGVDVLVGPDGPVVTETNARPTVDDADKYVPDFYDRLAGLVRSVTRA
ncbi:MAG: RimK family alpha-L-glutamate ligase [Halobacteriaceae archaeon]